MFNYNLINPINITYRNPKQDPAYKKEDAKGFADGDVLSPLNPDENRGQRHFPNGNKVQIDYTKNKVNIAQVIEDFKSTIAAINAPEDISGEVNSYLGLVEIESKKEKPSREIILSNLRNASKISDRFIEDSLKKPSTVVEDWVNALFLQNVELKSDPSFVNEAFRVQIPENKGQNADVSNAADGVSVSDAGVSAGHNDTEVFNIVSDAGALNNNENAANVSNVAQGAALDLVSASNDFQNSSLNIYDIPQNKVTLSEIKPIGQANIEYFDTGVVQNKSVSEGHSAGVQDIPAKMPEVFASAMPDADYREIEAQLQIADRYQQSVKNLTYSTTAPDEGKAIAFTGAASFENQVYKISSAANALDSGKPVADIQGAAQNTVVSTAALEPVSAISADKQTAIPVLTQLSEEEKAARNNFVRAKRIVKENGDPYNALKLYDEALKLVQNSDDENLKAAIHFERGKVFDDYDYAEFALKDYNSATKCSDNNLKTHAHLKMGRIYDDYVMFDPAVEQYSLAVETSEEAKNLAGKTKALRYLAGIFADRYDKENTEIFNTLAIDAAHETGSIKLIAKTLMEAAENFEYVGEDTKALKTYKEAAKVLFETGDYNLLSKNYESASEIMERLGNGAKAMSLLSKALQYRQKAELQTA